MHCGCLVDLGLPLGEFWVLDELAADCAGDGVFDFMLVAPPLHIPHAVGSPINPIAIKWKSSAVRPSLRPPRRPGWSSVGLDIQPIVW